MNKQIKVKSKEKLDKLVVYWNKRGFQVISQTETSAQLIKPKKFSLIIAIVLFVLAVFPFVIYLLWFLSKKDDKIFIQVTGNVSMDSLTPMLLKLLVR